eukprot:scaffold112617_cov57-Phaeocystis_antarctica.AAC.1
MAKAARVTTALRCRGTTLHFAKQRANVLLKLSARAFLLCWARYSAEARATPLQPARVCTAAAIVMVWPAFATPYSPRCSTSSRACSCSRLCATHASRCACMLRRPYDPARSSALSRAALRRRVSSAHGTKVEAKWRFIMRPHDVCSCTRRLSNVACTPSRHATKVAVRWRFINRNAEASALLFRPSEARSMPSHAPKVSPSSRLNACPTARLTRARFSTQTPDHALKTGVRHLNFHSRSTWLGPSRVGVSSGAGVRANVVVAVRAEVRARGPGRARVESSVKAR